MGTIPKGWILREYQMPVLHKGSASDSKSDGVGSSKNLSPYIEKILRDMHFTPRPDCDNVWWRYGGLEQIFLSVSKNIPLDG